MDLGQGIRKALAKITGAAVVDEKAIKELVKELQRTLISHDVNVKLVFELTKRIEEKALKEKQAGGMGLREHIIRIVYDELVGILGEKYEPKTGKQRILLCGVFGAGKCVHPKTRIPLTDGSTKTIKEIYDESEGTELVLEDGFVKQGIPVSVFAFDPATLRINRAEATTIWKLKKTEPLLKITLDNGSAESISTTPEHPFFTLDRGWLAQKRADELKVGDYIALPRNAPFIEQEWRLPLIENLPRATRVCDAVQAKQLRLFLKQRYGTLKKGINSLARRAYCQISAELKRGEIDAELLAGAVSKGFVFSETQTLRLAGGHRKVFFPLVLTPELAEFLGYVYGDGNLDRKAIHVTTEDEEVVQRLCCLSQKLFGIKPTILQEKRSKANLRRVSLSSKTVTRAVSKIFGLPLGKKSNSMKLPAKFMTVPRQATAAFLQAYFDCDGYVEEGSRHIEFCTASKEFAFQLRLLLLKHGISSGYSVKLFRGKEYSRVFLRAAEVDSFAKIGARTAKKIKRLNALAKTSEGQTKGNKLENLYVGSLLKEVREYFGASGAAIKKHVSSYHTYENEGVISRESLRKFLDALPKVPDSSTPILENSMQPIKRDVLLEKNGYLKQSKENIVLTDAGRALLQKKATFDTHVINWLYLLANSDLNFARIKKIEEDESTEYVYDLTVDSYHNFIAEGFIVHNTTTISKLAKFYQSKGLKVGLIAGDVHRPAAIDQLEQLAKQVHCDFYGNRSIKPSEIKVLATEGLDKLRHDDVIIFDSAGRSAFDSDLARELREIAESFKPDENFLVVSADMGQAAGKQAEEFNRAVPVTGVIVTKMDGSGKGGGALSAVHASKSRVAFIGTGEKPDALEVFDAKKFVARLVGFPDLETLLEKVKQASEEEALEKALESGELNYETFLAQMRAMKKMGPLKQVMQMLGAYDLPEELVGKSEEKMKAFEAAVLSMTKKERLNPDLMHNKSRQERVAKGAGLKPDEVRELVSNFDKMQKLLKGMKKNRGLLKRFSKLAPDIGKLGGMVGASA